MTSELRNVFSEEYKQKINNEPNYSEKLKLIRPNVLYFCKNRIWDQSEAEDVCQNTLVILASKESDYDSSKNFFSWALRICSFQIKAVLKKYKRSRLVYGDSIVNLSADNNYSGNFKDLISAEPYGVKMPSIGEDIDSYWEGSMPLNPSGSLVDSPDTTDSRRLQMRDRDGNTLLKNSVGGSVKVFNNQIPKDFFVVDDDKLFELLTLNLTEREELIFNLIREGYTNQEISEKIKLNVNSTNAAKTRLIKKLKTRLKSIQDYNKYDYQEF